MIKFRMSAQIRKEGSVSTCVIEQAIEPALLTHRCGAEWVLRDTLERMAGALASEVAKKIAA